MKKPKKTVQDVSDKTLVRHLVEVVGELVRRNKTAAVIAVYADGVPVKITWERV